MSSIQELIVPPGLKGVIVSETEIGDVRGDEGFYHYRDHSAIELAQRCSFEQVWYLMLHGVLPSPGSPELDDFTASIAAARQLSQVVLDTVRSTAGEDVDPIYVLRAALSVAAIEDDARPLYDCSGEARMRQAQRYAAMVPTILAAAHRVSIGHEPVTPDPSIGHVEDYLRMVMG